MSSRRKQSNRSGGGCSKINLFVGGLEFRIIKGMALHCGKGKGSVAQPPDGKIGGGVEPGGCGEGGAVAPWLSFPRVSPPDADARPAPVQLLASIRVPVRRSPQVWHGHKFWRKWFVAKV